MESVRITAHPKVANILQTSAASRAACHKGFRHFELKGDTKGQVLYKEAMSKNDPKTSYFVFYPCTKDGDAAIADWMKVTLFFNCLTFYSL